MSIFVADTNILLDLEAGRILEKLFQLDAQVVVPDILFRQELRNERPLLANRVQSLGLHQLSLTGESMADMIEMNSTYAACSIVDVAALALARQELGILLTGDQALRRASGLEDVEYHGTIWLSEKLVREGPLSEWELRRAFNLMLQADRRLPVTRFNQLLAELHEEGF